MKTPHSALSFLPMLGKTGFFPISLQGKKKKKKKGERYIQALTSIPQNAAICEQACCRCDIILEISGSLI